MATISMWTILNLKYELMGFILFQPLILILHKLQLPGCCLHLAIFALPNDKCQKPLVNPSVVWGDQYDGIIHTVAKFLL